ncbi:MAG: hypothetical protein ACQET1_05900 [Gemmatimonadota bacterium]
MPVHDAYARVTPYELLLPDEEFAGKWFPLIREEAEGRGGDLSTPESFVLLSQAAMALRVIRGEEDAPELIQQHGALLFHAFHFWEGGEPLYLLETEAARFLVENGPEPEAWEPGLPGQAGYIQLPHHLFWSAGEEGEVPESLDGIFWSAPHGQNVTLLVAMGIRKDRPGLAVVPLPTLPLTAAAPWASMSVRPDGEDFRSFMPGAELEGLYSVAAGAEAVKLAMRVFWYLGTFPHPLTGKEEAPAPPAGAQESPEPADPEAAQKESRGAAANVPEPTRLGYRRIVPETG